MSVEAPSTATDAEVLERIVESDHDVVLLTANDGAGLVRRLRQLVRRSGQALYLWRQETGLLSLRDGDVPVPGGRRLTDALRIVQRSMHFGIYLFDGAGEILRPQDRALLAHIAQGHDGPVRRVVLMDADCDYDAELQAVSLRLRVNGGDQRRPRLRDGRWV